MIQDLLNSLTDGHKVAPSLSSPLISAGVAGNTTGNVSVFGNRATGSPSSACGWFDPIVTYPAYPCDDIVFPTVAITNVVTSSGTEWYLTLTFTSCNPICNTWSFSYKQSGPDPVNQGGDTFTLDCSHPPYTHSIRIFPSGAISHHFVYNYTITSCCGTSIIGTSTL